jgi:hypothetical protein
MEERQYNCIIENEKLLSEMNETMRQRLVWLEETLGGVQHKLEFTAKLLEDHIRVNNIEHNKESNANSKINKIKLILDQEEEDNECDYDERQDHS